MSSEGWLKDFEVELTRKNKAKKILKKEIDDRIEQLRLLEADISEVLEKNLGNGTSKEGVEYDLLYARLDGGKP